jgi:hypothetical protein
MGSDQLRSLSSSQLRGLTTTQIAGLSSDDFNALNTTAYSILSNGNRLLLALWDGVACVDLTNPTLPTFTVIRNNPVDASIWTEGNSNSPANKLFTVF